MSERCARSRCQKPAFTLPGQAISLCLAHHSSLGTKRRSKYGNVRVASDLAGRSFDSKWEREFCEALILRERAGEITNLEFQKTFRLMANGKDVGGYRADAVWMEDGNLHIADAKSKGTDTDLFRLKAKIMESMGYPVEVYYKPRKR